MYLDGKSESSENQSLAAVAQPAPAPLFKPNPHLKPRANSTSTLESGPGFGSEPVSDSGPDSMLDLNARSAFNSACTKKVTSFVLNKIEKTASSTLFCILARFVILNNLNVMVPTYGGHLDVRTTKGAKPGM